MLLFLFHWFLTARWLPFFGTTLIWLSMTYLKAFCCTKGHPLPSLLCNIHFVELSRGLNGLSRPRPYRVQRVIKEIIPLVLKEMSKKSLWMACRACWSDPSPHALQGCTCTAACCCLNAFPCLKVLIYTSLLNVRNMWIWCHLVFLSCSAADRNSAIFTSSTSIYSM